jgi:hypothetical protein
MICFFAVLFLCFILDLIFFPVISSFQDVNGWKLRKIVRDFPQAQKGNSYLYEITHNIYYTVRLSEAECNEFAFD